MERKYKEWEKNRDRILLFADIMGFKEKVQKTKHAELVDEFRGFIGKLTKLHHLKLETI